MFFINGFRGEQLFIGSLDYTANREIDAWENLILNVSEELACFAYLLQCASLLK